MSKRQQILKPCDNRIIKDFQICAIKQLFFWQFDGHKNLEEIEQKIMGTTSEV